MLTRRNRKEYFYDKLHRKFVNLCMAVTLITGTMLLYSTVRYFMHTVPENRLKIKEQEEDLLSVGLDLEDVAST
ncbi:hypothetical protein M0802_005667 [Mischocyttarus mexicanus]|nr:hypothetical protein M0802_005667 [Mischocyttarus mexicanus]